MSSLSGSAMNKATLVVTELVRWGIVVLMIYLSVWQYCSYAGYTIFISNANVLGQFWGIFTAIIVGISIVMYLPWRILAIKHRQKYHLSRDERWRPAIVFYIVFAATPCFTLILVAYKTTSAASSLVVMTPTSVTILQMVVLGLVITEWAVKVQQEKFTFQLITAMALDFFFAYDVIAFIMMSVDTQVFSSGWVYSCFVFAVVAMFKYVPTQPIGILERGSSMGHLICILTSMFCNDIPFVVIRLATMIIFGTFLLSDMIFLMKNFFVLIFSCIQLGFIYHNQTHREAGTNSAEWASKPSAPAVDVNGGETDVDGKNKSSKWRVIRERVLIGDKREFRIGPDDVWSGSIDSNRIAAGETIGETGTQESGVVSTVTGSYLTTDGAQMNVQELDNEAYTSDK